MADINMEKKSSIREAVREKQRIVVKIGSSSCSMPRQEIWIISAWKNWCGSYAISATRARM